MREGKGEGGQGKGSGEGSSWHTREEEEREGKEEDKPTPPSPRPSDTRERGRGEEKGEGEDLSLPLLHTNLHYADEVYYVLRRSTFCLFIMLLISVSITLLPTSSTCLYYTQRLKPLLRCHASWVELFSYPVVFMLAFLTFITAPFSFLLSFLCETETWNAMNIPSGIDMYLYSVRPSECIFEDEKKNNKKVSRKKVSTFF